MCLLQHWRTERNSQVLYWRIFNDLRQTFLTVFPEHLAQVDFATPVYQQSIPYMYFNNLKVETQFFIFKNELTDIIINIRVCSNRNLVHDTSINNNWKIRHFKDYEEV